MSSSSAADSGAAVGDEAGARFARARALSVLRVRGRGLAVALLPTAVAVVLLVAAGTGRLTGGGWDIARWAVCGLAVVVLLLAGAVAAVVAGAKPALSPTVTVAETSAPDLYRMVRDLAERLGVPAPSAIALTPDCDSWLEDRTHPAHAMPGSAGDGTGRRARRSEPVTPVLVVGSPFLWWMRIAELRAVLAPVVAGTGSAAHPDIAAARRFVRGLDAAVAVAGRPGLGVVRRAALAPIGTVARLLLRACGEHAALMERGVAAAASERAQAVDYGLRIVAQEQVGLAYAGWDRLLTRVALPAWRMGRWPARLDAGVVSALTELSRRDRLAEGFASRLGERPACDLLEEPGALDEAASLLAARLFHGGPDEGGPDWSPVDWQHYPEEVVDRKWRTEAARLHRVLDDMGVRQADDRQGPPTLSRVLDHLSRRPSRDSHGSDGSAAARFRSRPASGADSATAGGVERVGGQHPVGQPAASPARRAGAGAPPETDALLGDTSDDSLPVVPRRLEALDAAAPAWTPPDATPSAPTTAEKIAPDPSAPDRNGPDLNASDPNPSDPIASDSNAPDPNEPAGTLPETAAPEEEPEGPAPEGKDLVGKGPRNGNAPVAEAPVVEVPVAEDASAEHATAEHVSEHASVASVARIADGPADTAADALAACISAELAREAAASHLDTARPGGRSARATDSLPLVPLQPPRTGRDLLADHVTAMVCCSAVDTAGAHPGLDWLDGPTLLVRGERHADLTGPVHSLVEDGDPGPLRTWLASLGVRPEKPVRLV